MLSLIEFLLSSVTNSYVRISMFSLSMLCNFIFLVVSIWYAIHLKEKRVPFILLSLFLGISLVSDIRHLLGVIMRDLLNWRGEIASYTFFSRIVWGLYLTQYQSVLFLLHYLHSRTQKIDFFAVINIAINISLSCGFFYHAFFYYATPSNSPTTLPIEIGLIKMTIAYFPLLCLQALFVIISSSARKQTPHVRSNLSRSLVSLIIICYLTELSSLLLVQLALLSHAVWPLFVLLRAFGTLATTLTAVYVVIQLLDTRVLTDVKQ